MEKYYCWSCTKEFEYYDKYEDDDIDSDFDYCEPEYGENKLLCKECVGYTFDKIRNISGFIHIIDIMKRMNEKISK
ncbi:MAG: hypothetical protein K0S67_2 [Nitrososphaeraceae archaeon]|jgi:hypothetical protein|nr:hypothetical protein [Nitrososphaeraceae archaeon]